MNIHGRKKVSRLRRIKRTESDVRYFEINVVFNGEPVELLEKYTQTGLKGICDNTCNEVLWLV